MVPQDNAEDIGIGKNQRERGPDCMENEVISIRLQFVVDLPRQVRGRSATDLGIFLSLINLPNRSHEMSRMRPAT
jgi:hypothetical protein